MSVHRVRRPTEDAAVGRVTAQSPQGFPPLPVMFADLVVAHAARDRHGVALCAHRLVRAAHGGKVGEL